MTADAPAPSDAPSDAVTALPVDDAATPPPGPVVVVGTGLIGTSVALVLVAAGVAVRLADADPVALAGAVARAAGTPETADHDQHDADVVLVVVAVPPRSVAAVVTERLVRHPGAVVTDVSSVKALPLRMLLAGPVALDRYVGSHPMAGSERSGPGAARADLFAGRPWAVTPHPQSRPSAVAAVHRLARLSGAVPVTLDAQDHDEAVAAVSHLPHVAAAVVAGSLASASGSTLALTGAGLRDVTRIAAGSPALWTQILVANARPVADGVRGLREGLTEFLEALEALEAGGGTGGDGTGGDGAVHRLGALLQRGVDGTARLPGRHGAGPERFGMLGVVIDDRPGQLARLFAAVHAVGVDIAEVRLDHRAGQAVGQVELAVDPVAVSRLSTALAAAGWTVHPGGDPGAD